MPDLVTAEELAGKIRLRVYRVRQLARSGRIPSLQAVPRGKRLFNVAEVMESLRGQGTAHGQAASPVDPDR